MIASTLLGAHPPVLPALVLVRSGALFGIPEGTIRVALSRMVYKHELVQEADGRYALSGHLLYRQQRQEAGRRPELLPWSGVWRAAVIVGTGRSPAERAVMRSHLARMRLAEMREGLWVRPDNLRLTAIPDSPTDDCLWSTVRFDIPSERIVTVLWDVKRWAEEAQALQDHLARWQQLARRTGAVEVLAPGFVLSASMLRHFNADPLLPPELLPPDWPGAEVRAAYEAFNDDFLALWRSFMGTDGAWDPSTRPTPPSGSTAPGRRRRRSPA